MESGHGKLDYGTPTDDEVTLPPHDRATEVPDFLDTDIRDRQTLLGHTTGGLATTNGASAWGSPKTDR